MTAAVLSTTDEVNATLAYLPGWIDGFDRRMLATDSRWIALGLKFPEFCGEMSDLASRAIMDQPAIVWC